MLEPRRRNGDYFTRWPKGADPRAPGGSSITTVSDLKPSTAALISLSLAATRGNQIKAAQLLGLNRNTLRKKIRDLDIQVFRTSN